MSRIQAVVFDVGNVVLQWDPRHLYRKIFAEEAAMEHFLETVCTMAWHVRHDAGASFEENAAPLKEQFPDHAALIDQWGERYLEMTPGRIEGTRDIIHELHEAGVATFGLTNMPSSIWPLLQEAYPELTLFRDTVVSGDEKTLKPAPEIYEILLSRTRLPAEQHLFIDDSAHNIDGAEALGLKGHHFKGAAALRSDLQQRGLLK